MFELITFLTLILLGYFAGSYAENKHYKSIRERERKLIKLPTITIKSGFENGKNVIASNLVSGSVVVSIDYFKRILAGLRFLFGGNVRAYETLIDRGRREAILRMKESAGSADLIVNMRIETSSIGNSANRKNALGSIEVFAYGTAIRFEKQHEV